MVQKTGSTSDDYALPEELLSFTVRHHFLRMPLLGQHNPITEADDWCGRTSASMVWNYHHRVSGDVRGPQDYIAHWRGPDGRGAMNLRSPHAGDIAFVLPGGNYSLLGMLKAECGFKDSGAMVLGIEENRDARLANAREIRGSLDRQREVFSELLRAITDNNPVVLHTGLSTSDYGGHIVVVCGFCEMADSDGGLKLWLLIADPAPPKTTRGPTCIPVKTGQEDDSKYLAELSAKHSLVMLRPGDWTRGRGYLYLLRASKLFEENTLRPAEKALWLDDLCNAGRRGGSFYHKSTPTALDPELVVTKNVLSGISLPLEEDPYALVSPVKYYVEAEEAGAGFYPLGVNQAMHGGVHLPPRVAGGKPSFVRSMAPGYIVAARLTRSEGDAATRKLLGNHNGFVLVRHEMVVDPDPQQSGQAGGGTGEKPSAPLPFYSLYMHMPATGWPASVRDAYAQVPWLRRLYLARHGAVFNLDPGRGPIGALHWTAEEVRENVPQACQVHTSDKDLSVTGKLVLRDGERYLGYFKKAPGDLQQACKALEAGAAVTFAHPFLVVGQGEVVGVLQRDEELSASGCLHWEIMAPASTESAIAKTAELIKTRFDLELGEVAEAPGDKKDNLLEKDEIESLLKGKLPTEAEQERLGEIMEAVGLEHYEMFHTAWARFMAKEASFAKGLEDSELIEPRFQGAADKTARLQKLVYPFDIVIDNSIYRVSATGDRPAPFRVDINYLDKSGKVLATATKELTAEEIKQPETVVRLKVPASAATLELATPSFHLDLAAQAGAEPDTSLARSMLGARWRGVALKHVSEWSPAGLRQLVPKLRQHKLMEPPKDKPNQTADEAVASHMPTTWYGVPRGDAHNPSTANGPVEVPILGPDGKELSLFDPDKGMLPAKDGSAEIHNLHPVTFVWLQQLLHQAKRSHFVTEYKSVVAGDDELEKPVFWGFVLPSGPLAVGRVVNVVAVRGDWGNGPVALCARPQGGGGGAPVTLVEEGQYQNGFFSAAVSAYFWGTWKLVVQGFENEPVREQGGVARLTIDVPKPAIAASVAAEKDPKTNLYALSIHFTENCPEALGGYFVYEHTKVTPPADAGFPESQSWVLDAETGGYITELKNNAKTVAGKFTLANFLSAPGAGSRVSIDLVRAAAKLRAASPVALEVVALRDDGRSATLVPRAKTTVAALTAVAERQGKAYNTTIAVSEVEANGKKRIELVLESQNVPAALSWTESPLCNPVYARRVVEVDASPFESKDGFYTGLKPGRKDAPVTPHYAWSAYSKAGAAKGFKLAKHLAAQVEALTAKTGLVLALRAVSADGLSAGLACDKWERNKERLKTSATALFATAELKRLPLEGAGAQGDEVLAVTVSPPPVITSGWMRCELDPRDVFGEILRHAQPRESERVWIKARFVAPNAEHVELSEGPLRTPGKKPSNLAGGDVLSAAVPGVFKSLGRPGFGALTASVAGKNLVLSVALEGARNDWSRARPGIFVNGVEKPSAQKPGPKSSTFLECTLPLDPKLGALAIEARVVNPDATFDGERVAIAPVTLAVSTVPRLVEPLQIEQRVAGRLTVSARVHACPSAGAMLKLRWRLMGTTQAAVSRLDKKTSLDALVSATVTYPKPAPAGDLQGTFEAQLDLKHLSEGQRYEVELGPSAADGTVSGVSVAPIRGEYPPKSSAL